MVVLNLNHKTEKKAPHKEAAKRSAQSKFGRFLNDSKTKVGVTALTVLTALGLTFMLPINQANAQGNKKDKGAEVKKEKEKIDINELKGYTEPKYEVLSENEHGFYFEVAKEKPILMDNGKKAVKILGEVAHDERIKEGGDKASSVMILLFDASFGGKSEAGWIIDLEDLRAEYKEMTGKELKYVHALLEHDEGSSGEFLQLYTIPASSKKAVEKEIIDPDMPIKIIKIKKNKETGNYEVTGYSELVTAALTKPDDKILAKK